MLSLMWVVQFADGRAIPQYDPSTGKENLYSEVERYSRAIVKAGWYPFTPKLARLLGALGEPVRLLPWSCRAEMDFKVGDEPILKRRRVTSVGVRRGTGQGEGTFYILARRRGNDMLAYVLDEAGERVQPREGAALMLR
jgi:hypothetical protein